MRAEADYQNALKGQDAMSTSNVTMHYMPRMRLLGVDWFGAFMWAVCVMSVLFVLNYGEHYDWWRSHEIWIGTVFAVVCKVIP